MDTSTLALVARGIARRPGLWRPHVAGDAVERHHHQLIAEPHMTVWMICWMPGQMTGFHDHDGAAGAVAVVEGAVCEERLRFAAAPVRSEHAAGDTLTFEADDIHRIGHLDGAPAITIHAYSGQIRRANHYEEGPGGVLTRRAEDLAALA